VSNHVHLVLTSRNAPRALTWQSWDVGMKVLVVEDDPDLLDLIPYGLGREGFAVITACDGRQALKRWKSDQPDLVLLDINLPGMSGFEVCRRIRQESRTPIIMLTARDREEDVVRGLQIGADDYVRKPFSHRELVARIKAVIARSKAGSQPGRVQVGDLALEDQTHAVFKAGRRVSLTRSEFRLLYMLVTNAGRVIPYSRLAEYAWGDSLEQTDASLVKPHISHLRAKLGLPGFGLGSIQSVPGVGYRLAHATAAQSSEL
jgi:DNA-binding response OmpR family regulator